MSVIRRIKAHQTNRTLMATKSAKFKINGTFVHSFTYDKRAILISDIKTNSITVFACNHVFWTVCRTSGSLLWTDVCKRLILKFKTSKHKKKNYAVCSIDYFNRTLLWFQHSFSANGAPRRLETSSRLACTYVGFTSFKFVWLFPRQNSIENGYSIKYATTVRQEHGSVQSPVKFIHANNMKKIVI